MESCLFVGLYIALLQLSVLFIVTVAMVIMGNIVFVGWMFGISIVGYLAFGTLWYITRGNIL